MTKTVSGDLGRLATFAQRPAQEPQDAAQRGDSRFWLSADFAGPGAALGALVSLHRAAFARAVRAPRAQGIGGWASWARAATAAIQRVLLMVSLLIALSVALR